MDITDEKVNFRGKAPGERNRPIRLAGSMLGPPCHICAFFNNRDDEYRVLLPFIKDGLDCGEKAVHTVDPNRRVVFTLSGRIKATRLAELQQLLECEAGNHKLVLDLKEVKLVDRDVVGFLASCETKGIKLVNCPAWIEKEAAQSEDR